MSFIEIELTFYKFLIKMWFSFTSSKLFHFMTHKDRGLLFCNAVILSSKNRIRALTTKCETFRVFDQFTWKSHTDWRYFELNINLKVCQLYRLMSKYLTLSWLCQLWVGGLWFLDHFLQVFFKHGFGSEYFSPVSRWSTLIHLKQIDLKKKTKIIFSKM